MICSFRSICKQLVETITAKDALTFLDQLRRPVLSWAPNAAANLPICGLKLASTKLSFRLGSPGAVKASLPKTTSCLCRSCQLNGFTPAAASTAVLETRE